MIYKMSYTFSLEKYSKCVAVVTGASDGIGKAIAKELVKQGMIVAGLARRDERVIEYAQELCDQKGKLLPFKCDLTSQDEILNTFKNIAEKLGPIHVLVNNAGLLLSTNIIDGDIQKWKIMLDTNILAVSICTREAIKSMKANNVKGHIININSTSGHRMVDQPNLSLYPASKHAVTAMTETSLSPGWTKTELPTVAFGPEKAQTFDSRPSLEPKDVADAVLYVLATPDHVNVKELIIVVQGQEA